MVTSLKCWEDLDCIKGWVLSVWIALFTHNPLPPAEEEKRVVDAGQSALGSSGPCICSRNWPLHPQTPALGSPVLLPQPAEPCSRVGALLWAPKSATLALVWGVPSPQSHSIPPRHSCWPHGDSSQFFKVKLSFRQTRVPGLSKQGDKPTDSV